MTTEAETATGLLRDSKLATGDHLDLDTECDSVLDDPFNIVARGVEDSKETNELEAVGLTLVVLAVNLVRNRERMETMLGELLNVGLETASDGSQAPWSCCTCRAR